MSKVIEFSEIALNEVRVVELKRGWRRAWCRRGGHKYCMYRARRAEDPKLILERHGPKLPIVDCQYQ
jgi:hypothetical protein